MIAFLYFDLSGNQSALFCQCQLQLPVEKQQAGFWSLSQLKNGGLEINFLDYTAKLLSKNNPVTSHTILKIRSLAEAF